MNVYRNPTALAVGVSENKFGYLFTVKTRENKIFYRYLANNHGGMFDWDTEKECSSHIVRRQHLSVPEMYLD